MGYKEQEEVKSEEKIEVKPVRTDHCLSDKNLNDELYPKKSLKDPFKLIKDEV